MIPQLKHLAYSLAAGFAGVASANENAPNLFDYVGPPIVTGVGSIMDYQASPTEVFEVVLAWEADTNPIALIGRGLRAVLQSREAQVGEGELVDAMRARREVMSRGLELEIPDRGIGRVELDSLQYLKQRELWKNLTLKRARGFQSVLFEAQ